MQANGDSADTAYRALFEANPHPMWVFERTSLRFLAVNDAALRQYGYSREEFLGLSILDIRPEEDAASAAESVSRSPSAPKVWRHRRKDSSTLLAEVTAHSLLFQGKEARLVMALDVTARERGAELLRRTNRTLEAVLEAAPVGMLVFDSRGEIVETNETARQLLGAEGTEPIAPVVGSVLRGEGVAFDEVQVSGGRWAEVAVRAVEIGPGSNGAVVVLTENTARREQQGRLREDLQDLESRVRERTSELQANLEEMDSFCFSVSHDLRGPLRAVDGFAQVVLNDPDASLSDDNRDALQRVRKAARRMGELIDGILTLSRLARAEYAPCSLDLSAIVSRAASSVARAYPNRPIQFVIAPDQSAYGDPRLVAALVEHLLDNAAKFSANRESAKVEFFPEGDGWAIRDDGVGLDMAYSSRLFKPFERLHGTNEYPGHGLGLAAASRIVRRHGGTIQATSTVGEGTTLRFTLASPEK